MTDTMKQKIFMTGGTGYIGGSFLHLMWQRNYLDHYDIRVLVRNPLDAKKLLDLGFTPVEGSLHDSTLLSQEAEQADIVFNTANCDHRESVVALLSGARKKFEVSGKKPILIHTSGAGVLTEDSMGFGVPPELDHMQSEWDETDAEKHRDIPDSAPHRFVDIEVFGAAEQGFINTYLVVPPTVFGVGLGPFASHRMSIQIPRLVYHSLIRRQVMTVGAGENIWPNVHVADLAELYLIIMEGALKDVAPSGLEGLYYPVSEHFSWKDVSQRIADLFLQRDILPESHVKSGLQPGWFWGSNVIVHPTNSLKLGWQPTHGGTAEMLRDIEHDVDLVIEAVRSNNH
jgi:nucleoside-diphosphate-sugar epimerase